VALLLLLLLLLALATLWGTALNASSAQLLTYANAVITIAIRLRFDYDVSRAPVSICRDST